MTSVSTTSSLTASSPTNESAEARKREVENALLVQTLCERQPSLQTRGQLLRYIAGELSREQAFADLYTGMH